MVLYGYKKMASSFSDKPPSCSRLQEIPPPQASAVSPSSVVVKNAAPGPSGPSVIVVNNETPSVVNQGSPLIQSFSCHICLACFTFWCCGVLFGLVAFILAVLAQSHSSSLSLEDRKTAHVLGKWSIGVSLAGLFVGIVVCTVVIVWVTVPAAASAASECHGQTCFETFLKDIKTKTKTLDEFLEKTN